MELNIAKGLHKQTIDEAVELIRKENLNVIHCSLTGVEVGFVYEEEVELCLQMELDVNPLLTPDELVDLYSLRHFAMSSGPAPSLRVHRDHNALVRVLRLDPNGPARVFAYLAGRLLFDSLVRKAEVNTVQNSSARLAYLIEFQQRLARMPKDWHKSLTPEDEAIKPAQNAITLLDIAAAVKPTPLQESKAAQRCLEALLRLDAIHSLREAFYNAELRAKLAHFRESHDWSFTIFALLLSKIEEEGVIKMRTSSARPMGNAMALTAALESISWSSKRSIALVKQIEDAERKGLRVNGQAMLDVIKQIQANPNVDISDKDKERLESAARSLSLDLNSVRYSDKRLAALHHTYGKAGVNRGNTVVKHGAQATKALVESYLDSGQRVPAALQQKMDSLVKAGKVSPAGKSKPKATSKTESKIGSANMNMLANLVKNSTLKF